MNLSEWINTLSILDTTCHWHYKSPHLIRFQFLFYTLSMTTKISLTYRWLYYTCNINAYILLYFDIYTSKLVSRFSWKLMGMHQGMCRWKCIHNMMIPSVICKLGVKSQFGSKTYILKLHGERWGWRGWRVILQLLLTTLKWWCILQRMWMGRYENKDKQMYANMPSNKTTP